MFRLKSLIICLVASSGDRPCSLLTKLMGSIYNENFGIIINRIDDVIEKAKKMFNNDKCNKCFIKGYCKRGCIALSINNGKFVSDSNCELRKQAVIATIRGGKNYKMVN